MIERIKLAASQSFFIRFAASFKDPYFLLYFLIWGFISYLVIDYFVTKHLNFQLVFTYVFLYSVILFFKRSKEEKLIDIYALYLIVRLSFSILLIIWILSPYKETNGLLCSALILLFPFPEFFISSYKFQRCLTLIRVAVFVLAIIIL